MRQASDSGSPYALGVAEPEPLRDPIRHAIDRAIPGWSGPAHWLYFHDIVRRGVRSLCMLGVYHGRDIAYLLAHFHASGVKDFRVVGIDLFADVPGADWPPDKVGLSWQDAGFGEPPCLERARLNLAAHPGHERVELVRANAITYLSTHDERFDCVYVDIAHDYDSTRQCILAGHPHVTPTGFLAGDDFSNAGTWGVERAVKELFLMHSVFAGWIWEASPRYLLRG